MIPSKKAGSFPEDLAQARRTRAMAAAASITSAYSAVLWPSSSAAAFREARIRSHRHSDLSHLSNHDWAYTAIRSTASPPSGRSRETPCGHEHRRDHRCEDECGEDQEHEGEEHEDWRPASPFLRQRPSLVANVPCQATELLREGSAQTLSALQGRREPPQISDVEAVGGVSHGPGPGPAQGNPSARPRPA